MNSHNCFFLVALKEMELVHYNCHFTDKRVRKNHCSIVSLFHSLFVEVWVGFPSYSQHSISLKVLELIQYCYQSFKSTTPCSGGTLLGDKGEPI